MGARPFSRDEYVEARRKYGVTHSKDVTREAERHAQTTGRLSEIVDPAIGPMRYSKIRLNPHQKKWIVTMGCPMDIEVSCDTTGSMGKEVDTEMEILPNLYEAVAKVLPGYDPQLCLGIFGDVCDKFVMCRPQFEMEAEKIVRYLKEMAPQRKGGDAPEDPQYAMLARAYLTNAYTNRIGLKGYHFIVTDADCHESINRSQIQRIFGEDIFETELKNMADTPTLKKVVEDLKEKTHQFVLVVSDNYYGNSAAGFWSRLCGEKSVIDIDSTKQLPEVISAIIGLTEGTVDMVELEQQLRKSGVSTSTIVQLSNIDIGAQVRLRRRLPHPVPKVGDIFLHKEDLWPIQPGEVAKEAPSEVPDEIVYL